jgi:hypothetical protein
MSDNSDLEMDEEILEEEEVPDMDDNMELEAEGEPIPDEKIEEKVPNPQIIQVPHPSKTLRKPVIKPVPLTHSITKTTRWAMRCVTF